jgi:hypothetical protein
LPADFEVALQGVDTRLKALQPGTTLGDIAYSSATANTSTRLPIGTTGQVLAVSGGVPAWTTTADVTPLTTKGDLFTFDTADARLGVGTNGQTLVADSSTATGLKWATPATPTSGMTLINRSSFSGVSTTTTTFDNVFTSSYTSYYVVIEKMTVTAGESLKMQFRYAGPTTEASANYYGSVSTVKYTGATGSLLTSGLTKLGISPGLDGGIQNISNFTVTNVGNSNQVTCLTGVGYTSYDSVRYAFGGELAVSRTYTGLIFSASAGNITGTISVFGLAI